MGMIYVGSRRSPQHVPCLGMGKQVKKEWVSFGGKNCDYALMPSLSGSLFAIRTMVFLGRVLGGSGKDVK